MRGEDEVIHLAAEQHSVVGSWQLRALGVRRQDVVRMREAPGWVPLSERVFARSGAEATDDQVLMAAVLDASPGAAVSGPTAAWMWGVPGVRLTPVHVVRPRGVARRPSTLAVVHEVVDLHPSQIKVVRGIPVISPGRLVCELCATHPHRAEKALDRLWTERLLDGRTFRRTVEQLAGRGRTGSPLMRALDAARGPTYVPPASGLERRFIEISDFPMLRQVDLGDEEWCGRVDFKDPELPLIVEIQSEKYHTSLVDRAADAARKARLEAAGAVIVEVWDFEVWHDPPTVRERIRKARWALLAANRRRMVITSDDHSSPVRGASGRRS